MFFASFLFFFVFPLQEDLDRTAKDFIERLRSDNFEERDAATKGLVALGKSVLPYLEPLLKDPDAEVRGNARTVIDEIHRGLRKARIIKEGIVPARILKFDPQLPDRIVSPIASERERALKDLIGADMGQIRSSSRFRSDRRKYFLSVREQERVVGEFPAEIHELVRLWSSNPQLRDTVRGFRCDLLIELVMAGLANKEDAPLRAFAAEACGILEIASSVDTLRALLKDENPNVVAAAIDGLRGLNVKSATSEICPLLADECKEVRVAAFCALYVLGAPEFKTLARTMIKERTGRSRASK